MDEQPFQHIAMSAGLRCKAKRTPCKCHAHLARSFTWAGNDAQNLQCDQKTLSHQFQWFWGKFLKYTLILDLPSAIIIFVVTNQRYWWQWSKNDLNTFWLGKGAYNRIYIKGRNLLIKTTLLNPLSVEHFDITESLNSNKVKVNPRTNYVCVCVLVYVRLEELFLCQKKIKKYQRLSSGGVATNSQVTGHYYSCQSIGSDQQGVKENTKQKLHQIS